MRFIALCSVAVAAFPAAGQSIPTAGVEPPAQSFSLDDDGTALAGNPGGLAFVRGLEADLLHSGSYDASRARADALHFTGGTGPLSLGVGWDWVRHSPCTDPRILCLGDGSLPTWTTRRSSVGGALRLGNLGIGVVHHGFSGGEVNGLSSWDFGVLARPFSWLSAGAAALDADRPPGQPRRWALSLGLRPLGESPEVAADLRWSECTGTGAGAPCGLANNDLFLTVRTKVSAGVHLFGQVARLFGGNVPVSVLAGAQIDLPHLGVAYGPRLSSEEGYRDAYRVRLSTERWPAVRLPGSRAALVDLDKALHRPKANALALLFGSTARDPMAQTLAALHRLSQDRRVRAVVLRTGGLPVGLGKAEELRTAIEELQVNGKKVVFYLESAGDIEYSVAASADRIYAAPQAVLQVNGFSATALFAAAGLDKLGVKAEFFRVGAYKNAPDTFTRRDMSSEQREVQGSLLDDVYGRYLKYVAARRHLDEGKLKNLLDQGLLKPAEAVQAGLLDGLVYPDQLEEVVGKLLGGKVALEKTGIELPAARETRWGPPRKIAVVRVEGDILRGEGARDPFGAVEIAGSDPIARRIRRAADDPEVAAIVVRIDSPGGDGNASDLIWRELVRARKEKKKPVIASMGDVAASGGYYVAAGADEIWAEPSTVTGSIGVFIGHFDAEELFDKLGLNLTTTKRGRSADLFSPARGLTDKERAMLQGWVESFYDQFLDRVAEARRMKKEDVDAVARGRIWTGAQAADRGLVDYLGGFTDALDSAKKRAHLGRDAPVELDDEWNVVPELTDLAGPGVLSALPGGLGQRAVRALHLLGEPQTLRAALPFDLEIR